MSGLENMKRQILDEANHSAEEQISKARTKAEEILREAREQMEEQSAVMAKKSEDETKDYAQRIHLPVKCRESRLFCRQNRK